MDRDSSKPKAKPKKLKQLYTIRDIIKQNHRGLVEDQIPYEANNPKYLGSYQRAVTAVKDNMTEEELADAEEIAK